MADLRKAPLGGIALVLRLTYSGQWLTTIRVWGALEADTARELFQLLKLFPDFSVIADRLLHFSELFCG